MTSCYLQEEFRHSPHSTETAKSLRFPLKPEIPGLFERNQLPCYWSTLGRAPVPLTPTFTVGKPCCVRSFTEPRLPSVRYRARCWVSGCTTIFSSFPSLLVGYWPHNMGVFFPPVPFGVSDALGSQSRPWKTHYKQLPSKNKLNHRKAKKDKERISTERRFIAESELWSSVSEKEGNLQEEEERCFPASSIQCKGNCFAESEHKGWEKQLALNYANKQKKADNLLFPSMW